MSPNPESARLLFPIHTSTGTQLPQTKSARLKESQKGDYVATHFGRPISGSHALFSVPGSQYAFCRSPSPKACRILNTHLLENSHRSLTPPRQDSRLLRAHKILSKTACDPPSRWARKLHHLLRECDVGPAKSTTSGRSHSLVGNYPPSTGLRNPTGAIDPAYPLPPSSDPSAPRHSAPARAADWAATHTDTPGARTSAITRYTSLPPNALILDAIRARYLGRGHRAQIPGGGRGNPTQLPQLPLAQFNLVHRRGFGNAGGVGTIIAWVNIAKPAWVNIAEKSYPWACSMPK